MFTAQTLTLSMLRKWWLLVTVVYRVVGNALRHLYTACVSCGAVVKQMPYSRHGSGPLAKTCRTMTNLWGVSVQCGASQLWRVSDALTGRSHSSVGTAVSDIILSAESIVRRLRDLQIKRGLRRLRSVQRVKFVWRVTNLPPVTELLRVSEMSCITNL